MAFTTATFTRLADLNDGRVMLVVTFTGNAGETPVEIQYPVNLSSTPSADYFRAFAMADMTRLNATRNFKIGATPSIGTVLDTTTPLPTPPVSTFGSFVACSLPFTPGATPQDVFTISGSATRTVTVTRMSITTVQTTAGINTWLQVKRSTANTGGTSAAVGAVPINSTFPAATASVLQYTANPTAGTLVGRTWSGKVTSPAVSIAALGDLEKAVGSEQPIALIGTAQSLSWNFNGAGLPGGLSVQACVWWTEN